MSGRKSGMDTFWDAMDKAADGIEKGLGGLHHPDKDYDAADAPRGGRVIDIDPVQGMSVEQKLMMLRMQLYAAAQKLRGEELEEFRNLIDEVRTMLEVKHGKRT